MHKRNLGVLAAGLLMSTLIVTAAAPLRAQTKTENSGMPKVGDMAPDFTLKYIDASGEKEAELSDYRGKKNVVVAFYIFAFTGG